MAFGGVRALSEVSVSFEAGEICGLIGPNGAGKTTLFDCLTGIRRPTSGSIRYGGEEVTGRSATGFARQGMRRTFQRQQIFGRLPVEDNALVALEGGGGARTRWSRDPPPRTRCQPPHRPGQDGRVGPGGGRPPQGAPPRRADV